MLYFILPAALVMHMLWICTVRQLLDVYDTNPWGPYLLLRDKQLM
jgi:hypothetical protein